MAGKSDSYGKDNNEFINTNVLALLLLDIWSYIVD